MADAKLTALTEISALAIDDQLYIVDKSDTTDDAAGSSRRVQLDRVAGFFNPAICNGRLTLESGVPASTTDQAAKTSVFFTPYNGNRIAVFDGTRWELYTFSQLTLSLGTLTSGKNYDVFIFDSSGTLTLELSAAWTNDTTRADALTTQDGIQVKSGSTTRRYLGTIRTTSTTTTEDSKAKRFVWNQYNRALRHMQVTETTDSWNYTTATWRQTNGASTNIVEYVSGAAETVIVCRTQSLARNPSSGANAASGVGVDSNTTNSAQVYGATVGIPTASGDPPAVQVSSTFVGTPGLGYHSLRWLEISEANGTTTWFGDIIPGILATGMTATVEA